MNYSTINELKERFINDFKRFDKRLPRINRRRIYVQDCSHEVKGCFHVTCRYYGVNYGQTYFT